MHESFQKMLWAKCVKILSREKISCDPGILLIHRKCLKFYGALLSDHEQSLWAESVQEVPSLSILTKGDGNRGIYQFCYHGDAVVALRRLFGQVSEQQHRSEKRLPGCYWRALTLLD